MSTKIKRAFLFLIPLAIVSIGYLVFVVTNSKKTNNPPPINQVEPKPIIVQKETLKVNSLSNSGQTQLTEGGILIGFNKKFQVSTFNNNEEQVIYTNPSSLFSYKNGVVAILERDTNVLSIVNLNTKRVLNKFDSTFYQPIISMSLSLDGNYLYFIGKYNSKTYDSNIYTSPVNSFSPSLVVSTKTTKIDALDQSTLLTYRYTDQLGKNYAEIVDVSSKKTTKQFYVDSYSISSSGKKLAVNLLSKITVFDIANGQLTNSIPLVVQKPSFVFWIDDSTLIVISNYENYATFSRYKLNENDIKPDIFYTLNTDFVRSVIASSSNTIVIFDEYNDIIKISLN